MRKTCLLVSLAAVDLENGKTIIQFPNPNEHVYTLEANTNMAIFRKPTSHQAANFTPMPVEHLKLITDHPEVTPEVDHKDAVAVINQLFLNPEMKSTNWYPTPETFCEPDQQQARSCPLPRRTSHVHAELQMGRIASLSVSTSSGRQAAGKVQLHLC